MEAKTNTLVQKIPTLRRIDRLEYLQFILEPMPRIDHAKVEKIRVAEHIPGKFLECFESDYLNVIQSIVFDFAYNNR